MDEAFTLRISLRRADYLSEGDLKSFGLAPVDKDDVSPPRVAVSLARVKLSVVEVAPMVRATTLTSAPPAPIDAATPCRIGLRRKSITVTRLRKAPYFGIRATLGCVTADAVAGNQPGAAIVSPEEEVDWQGPFVSGGGGSSHGKESAQAEEELSLISADLLLPRYRELVLASIHLAPPCFHEGVSCYPLKKLLERTLADNIRVSCLYFFFVVCLSFFIFIICLFTFRVHIIH